MVGGQSSDLCSAEDGVSLADRQAALEEHADA
jgi:hypothetical protein